MTSSLVGFSYVLASLILGVAFYFFRTHSKNAIRRAMAYLAFSTGMWVLTTTIGAYRLPGVITEWSAPLTYLFGLMLVNSLFIFCILFPIPSFKFDGRHIFFLHFPVLIFAYILLGTNFIIASYQSGATLQGVWIGGPLYNLYNVYLTALYIGSLVILIQKFTKVDGINRVNLNIVFWSFFLGGSPGIINDLVLPLTRGSASTPFIGTLSTVIWLGLTCYILVKK